VSQRKRAHAATAKISYRRSEGIVAEKEDDGTTHTGRSNKKMKTKRDGDGDDGEQLVDRPDAEVASGPGAASTTASKFAGELELAMMRNGSEPFKDLYRQVWPLTRSLPELLHNAGAVVDCIVEALTTTTTTVTPTATAASNNSSGSGSTAGTEAEIEEEEEDADETEAATAEAAVEDEDEDEADAGDEDAVGDGDDDDDAVVEDIDDVEDEDDGKDEDGDAGAVSAADAGSGVDGRGGAGQHPRTVAKSFNLATLDVLRLLAVLADDLRHEIHPHLHARVLPCLLGDLLEVLRTSGGGSGGGTGGGGGGGGSASGSGSDDVVAIAEAIFRTVAFVFRYDAAALLAEGDDSGGGGLEDKVEPPTGRKRKKSTKAAPCLERLRAYYGATLAHPRAVVRKLAAETFAALVRQLPAGALALHLKRVVKAFAGQAAGAAAAAAARQSSARSVLFSTHQHKRLVRDAADGVSHLLWFAAKGAARQLHSTAGRVVLDVVLKSVASAAADGGRGDGGIGGGGSDALQGVRADSSTEAAVPAPVQFDVAMLFFQHMCRHLAQSSSLSVAVQHQQQQEDRGGDNGAGAVVASVLRAVIRHASGSYQAAGAAPSAGAAFAAPLACYFALVQQVLDFRSGFLARALYRRRIVDNNSSSSSSSEDDEYDGADTGSNSGEDGPSAIDCVVDDLLVMLGRILSGAARRDGGVGVMSWPDSCRSSAVRLLCSVWASAAAAGAAPSSRRAGTVATIRAHITRALHPECGPSGPSTIEAMAKIVVQDLLVRLPDGPAAMESVGSILLSSAARCVDDSTSSVGRSVVLSVALSTRALRHRSASKSAPVRRDESDQLVEWSLAQCARIAADERNSLIQSFISASPAHLDASDPRLFAEYAERAVCASFCALTTGTGCTGDRSNTCRAQETCLEWLLALGDSVSQSEEYSRAGCDNSTVSLRLAALESLALECAAAVILPLLMAQDTSDSASGGNSAGIKVLKRLQQLSERHLLRFPQSPSAVKSAAAVTKIMTRVNHNAGNATDEVFDALIPNLLHESHFLRLHSLEVLAALPSRPYVVDHADLDLSQDLDEEPTSRGPAHASDRASLTGMSDVLNILLRIEPTNPTLPEERTLLSLIGRVEVLGRSGRLPVVHAEAAASHMLGLLHCKFAPVWPSAVRAVAALVKGHEACSWPWIQRRLESLSNGDRSLHGKTDDEGPDDVGLFGKHVLLVEKGDASPFQDDLDFAKETGYVSRHESADLVAVFESSWSVVEKAPTLMMRHSKLLVPLFLRFMHFQYFGGNLDDPDARELQLLSHIDESTARYAPNE
jgi:hypothetical protein